jgi:hypothetical protein
MYWRLARPAAHTESPISRALTCARRLAARCGAADGETVRPGDGARGGRSVRNIVRAGDDERAWEALVGIGAGALPIAGSAASCCKGLLEPWRASGRSAGIANARGCDGAEERGASARDGTWSALATERCLQ